jgi:hypothetical protein
MMDMTALAELKAGRELDALIAEKVFGFVPCTHEAHDAAGDGWLCFALPESPDQGGECRSYSTEIADAWLIVEKLCADGWNWESVGRESFRAHFYRLPISLPDSIAWPYGGSGETMPLAICRAAMIALASDAGQP